MHWNPTCSGYRYPRRDQPKTYSCLRSIAHKINREHETFEVLAFQGIEYAAFLKEYQESERTDHGPVPSSLTADPLRL
jgi:hypothetical protein